jgi:hypothetical protein
MTEQDILREFEKRAIQVIEDNKKHFLQYKELWNDEQFLSDNNTVVSIIKKYEKRNIDFPLLIGLQEGSEFIGYFQIEGTNYEVSENLFDTKEGIDVIRRMLDLLGIEYTCKNCLVKSMCKVNTEVEECEGADELFNDSFVYGMLKDILDHILPPV